MILPMHSLQLLSRRRFLGATAAALAATNYQTTAQDIGRGSTGQQPPPGEKSYPLIVPGYFGTRPGIQLGTQLSASASDDDMRFARQLGVEWVMTSLRPEESTLANYQAVIRRFAAQGENLS